MTLTEKVAEVRRRVQAGELDLRDVSQMLIGHWTQDFIAELLTAAVEERALREKIGLQEIALNDMCVSLNEARAERDALVQYMGIEERTVAKIVAAGKFK